MWNRQESQAALVQDPVLQQGQAAYAAKQAAMQYGLFKKFKVTWSRNEVSSEPEAGNVPMAENSEEVDNIPDDPDLVCLPANAHYSDDKDIYLNEYEDSDVE